eukprot:TRINITY_DN8270_c0_g3_i3.p1 TRINITY_DN8270_c0_g3~~TRINITY_DN8270_c0_g3_i3.p1  ORF type:complete len:149 (-),score=41.48 TRINITY_DN8270_c0_g3_i3:26-472(-)
MKSVLTFKEQLLLVSVSRTMKAKEKKINALEEEQRKRDLKILQDQQNSSLMAGFMSGATAAAAVVSSVITSGLEIASVAGAPEILMYGAAWELMGIESVAAIGATTLLSTTAIAAAAGKIFFLGVVGFGYLGVKKITEKKKNKKKKKI